MAFLPDSVRKLVIAACSRDSLKALSLVSKHWHSLVEAALWLRLDYKPKPLAELADASLNLMPRIGRHVRAFTVTRWYLSADFHPIGRDPADEEQALIRQLEWTLDLPGRRLDTHTSLAWRERVAAVQNALLARALRACTQMSELNAKYSLAPFTVRDGATWSMPEEAVPNRIITAMKTSGRLVKRARLATGPLFIDGEPVAQLNRLIALLPQCEILDLQYDASIDVFVQWTPDNLDAWMKAIASLKSPTKLSTNGFDKWDTALCFLQIDLPRKLREFAADRCSVSVFSVKALGRKCGDVLTSLVLADLTWSLTLVPDECDGPFHFPVLRRLVVRTEIGAYFLDALVTAPLVVVVLARESYVEGFSRPFVFSGGLQKEHDVEEIFAMCTQHSATLQTVWVHQDHLTSGHGQLEPYLRGHGLAGGLFSGPTPAFLDDA